ncbi:nucleoside 2-deoxyribosyltransferase [Staphylococcus shinii]|uniref:nucleoside 2-deoxyribosyltransferase n=1 Tax=Staphylococcus shinii TaxID=2912228 RepID=UPI003CE77E05
MKKFYIASSFQNKEMINHLSQILESLDYIQTYNWTKNENAISIEQLKSIGRQEYKGIIDSDFLIVVLPGGKGTHVELGIALSQSKPIYLYSQDSNTFHPSHSCTFYHLPNVRIVAGEIDELLNTLKKDFAM